MYTAWEDFGVRPASAVALAPFGMWKPSGGTVSVHVAGLRLILGRDTTVHWGSLKLEFSHFS